MAGAGIRLQDGGFIPFKQAPAKRPTPPTEPPPKRRFCSPSKELASGANRGLFDIE